MLSAEATERTAQILAEFEGLQLKIEDKALKGIETTPYSILFTRLKSRDWEVILKDISKCFTLVHDMQPLISQYNYFIGRMDHRVHQIPFNTPNPNLQQSRLAAITSINSLTSIRDDLTGFTGFTIDFMQKFKTVLESSTVEGDKLNYEIGKLLQRKTKLRATFSNWLTKDIFSDRHDYLELIEESRNNALEFNELRKGAYSSRGL